MPAADSPAKAPKPPPVAVSGFLQNSLICFPRQETPRRLSAAPRSINILPPGGRPDRQRLGLLSCFLMLGMCGSPAWGQDTQLYAITSGGKLLAIDISTGSATTVRTDVQPPSGFEGNVFSLEYSDGYFYAGLQKLPISSIRKGMLMRFGFEEGDQVGITTDIGGYSPRALAKAPGVSGSLYVSFSVDQDTEADAVAQIDLTTGQIVPATTVYASLSDVNSLSFSPEGVLFAARHFDYLYEFNLNDGTYSPSCYGYPCWDFSSSSLSVYSIAVHPVTGDIYAAVQDDLYRLDISYNPATVTPVFIGNVIPSGTLYPVGLTFGPPVPEEPLACEQGDGFVQDQVITQTPLHPFAYEDSVSAGNHVTGPPYGNVTITGGDVVMKSLGYVKLDEGFSVQGGTLTVTVDSNACD